MIGFSDAVQIALVQAMVADAGIAGLVGDRVFDDVPDEAEYPYISLGPENWQPFEPACLTGAEGVVQIDVWSASVGRVECKAITERVAALFNAEAAPVVPDGGWRISGQRVALVQLMSDPGSRTRHGVIQVEMTIERDAA